MSFQRAPISLVRSIRHVSLVRDWARSREADHLPHYSAFQPDERSGDAADMLIAELQRDGDVVTFAARSIGERVEQILGRPIMGRQVRDGIEPKLVVASRPIWQACILHRMPIYSVLPVIDRDGRPVTIEHIYLPYRLDAAEVGIVVAAFHAWSTEGRFKLQGLLTDVPEGMLFPVTVIDPALTAPIEDGDHRFESI